MGRIKTIIFDLGGVILTLAPEQAMRRFEELGVKDASKLLNSYTQTGIFGDLERGKISPEEFRLKLSELVGHEVSYQDCCYAWQGYVKELPERNKIVLKQLREEGYRLVLLSNTNPFMMEWVNSTGFDGEGHSIAYYMDACYLSYQLKVMKPDPDFFRQVLKSEQVVPSETLFLDDGQRNVAVAGQLGIHTLCPVNGEDWTEAICLKINELNQYE